MPIAPPNGYRVDGSLFLMINSFETGGTERQFVELANRLRAHAIRVNLGFLQQKGPLLNSVVEVRQIGLGGGLYGIHSIKSRLKLLHHLRESGIAVAHSFDFYTNLSLIPAAWLARVPVIIGSHRQLGDLLTPAQFRAQSAVFRLCDRVVCNSHAAAERLISGGLSREKIAVLGNGLPAESFARPVPALPRDKTVVRVGMIARMNAPYKNHSLFLRSAARLCRRIPNFEILLIGDGPLRSGLENQAKELGIAAQVRFLGDRRDISALLASMDVSVVCSDSESLSNVILESMAAGVAVVATSVGGNGELGGEGRSVLIPPNDEEALAVAVQGLIERPQLRCQIAIKAQRFVEENFSLQCIAVQYASMYSELLDDKRRRNGGVVRAGSSSFGTRVRVAFIAPTLRYVGGQAVQADLLLRHWVNDPDVEARFIPVDPTLGRGLGWIERIPLLRTICREPLYIHSLWKNLKGIEVAHIFSASYSSFLVAPLPAWFIARLRGAKTVINYRNGECRDHMQKSGIARRVLHATDRLVVPSGYLLDVFREFDLAAEVVPNVVDLCQFKYRVRKPMRPHLVCTRGFHRYYGVDVVVRAFAEIQKIHPESRLDLVGGGPTEPEIRRMIQQLGLCSVHFKGVISRDEIAQCYDRAHIFINGSNLDNMPVSVLEAFASGTPVISTAPESMPYLVEHERTGLLSAPGNSSALAANVLRVLDDPELALSLAENAREQSRIYSWQSVRQQWLEIYRNLLSRKRESARQLASTA